MISHKWHDPELRKAALIAAKLRAEMRSSAVLSSGSAQTGQFGQQASQQSAAQAAALAIQNFLKVAPTKYYAILGTIPAGSAGGATSNVVWQQPIPIIPAFCVAIDYTIQLPTTLTLGATTGSATLSPFAPYSAFLQQMTLGGAPPWPLTELTPWYLDLITHKNEYDPANPGLAGTLNTPVAPFVNTLDQGPVPDAFGLNPGATVTNTTGSPTNTNYAFNFRLRQQLQRKRHLLWGAVPFGDPENRPNNLVQMAPLIGTAPEQSLFVAAAGTGTAAVVQASQTVNVYAKYNLAYIDLLPPTITQVPQPLVSYGLQLTPFSITGQAAGIISPITHRTAQIYTAIHHLLINNQLPIRADYFGLWDTQDQQSARWSYDASANTFTQWFDNMQRIYRRYFMTGHYFVDMESGVFPEIPSVTPLDSLMSPDQNYANTFGVPITPAMTTAIRIPTGTSLTNPYTRVYSFGLVKVPY